MLPAAPSPSPHAPQGGEVEGPPGRSGPKQVVAALLGDEPGDLALAPDGNHLVLLAVHCDLAERHASPGGPGVDDVNR